MNADKLFANKFSVIALAIFCCFLWGSAFPAVKISYGLADMAEGDIFSKLVFAGTRFFISSVILLIMVRFVFALSLKIKKKHWVTVILLGILQTFLQEMLFYIGLANTAGAKASVLSATDSFFVVLLAHFWLCNDKINARKVIGLFIGFLGIVWINFDAGIVKLDFSLKGEGLLILFGLVNGIGTILAKKLSADIHPFVLTTWQMLIGSAMLLLTGLSGPRQASIPLSGTMAALILYLAALSAVAFCIWYSLLKYNAAGVITLYKFFIPVFGAILSFIFLPGERFTFNLLAAIVLVVIGLMIVNKDGRKTDAIY